MMMFTNSEDYKTQRAELMNEAKKLLDSGNVADGNEKMKEIEELDKDFENFAAAQANLNALAGVPQPSVKVDGAFGAASDGVEYRKAFMNYVLTGKEIPADLANADANTKTTDAGAVIPETIMQRIIEKMESTGMILPLVTRTNYKGGLAIPTSSVKPTAVWVAEGSGSDKQKKTVAKGDMVTFAYHKLRCAISVSLEVDTMALAAFETTFVNNVVEAMTKAVEQAIINGTGNGQPKGILAETAEAGQNIDIAGADKLTYGTLCDAEAALPLAYENDAVWFMTKKTFMEFAGMVDQNGQPISRVNYGISGKPERILLGRTVILNDYMNSYSDAPEADAVFAFLFNPKDYILNTNLNLTVKKYEDNETDDIVTKAIMLADGKVVDKNSLVTLTKKNA